MTTGNETRAKKNAKTSAAKAARLDNGNSGNHSESISGGLHEIGGIARNLADAKIEQVRELVSTLNENSHDKVEKMGLKLAETIRTKPITSIFIAAGVGLMLGRYWMRR